MDVLTMLSSPWAIMPERLTQIIGIYEAHTSGQMADLKALEAKMGKTLDRKEEGYTIENGVAVIPIEGVIAKKMNLFHEISGGASTDLIERDFRKALADPSARSILLVIDSPGGSVMGIQELSNLIYESRGKKPIAAYTEGMLASAAYWLASAADQVFISGDTVQTGSIGVVAAHIDVSKREEQMGIKTTEIVAGKYKRIASQYAPLTEEGRATIQDQVDYVYSVFVNDIGRNRRVKVDRVLSQMADGKVFIGKQGLEAGLVDGISSMGALITRLSPGAPFKAQTGATQADFFALVDRYQKEKGCRRSQAIIEVARAHPETHQAYIDRVNR
jgi:capsid assembly protease